LADERYSSAIAEALSADVLERFLRYVKIDTRSGDDLEAKPRALRRR